MNTRLALESLGSCSGCEMSLLNLGEGLLSLAGRIELVHLPLLMDHKYCGPSGQGRSSRPRLPSATLGIITGNLANQHHLEIAQTMRRQCRVLWALGTCATHGGIPALVNQFSDGDLMERYYRSGPTTEPAPTPGEAELPPRLPRTLALDEKVEVDLLLPGCPPHPDFVARAITAFLEGRSPDLPAKSVCDTCPTRREGKGQVKQARRFLLNARYDPSKPLSDMRCLLEQGFLCLGPVTRAGCAGALAGPPQCLSARVPCEGCFGPVKPGGNQMLDMLNALASNGVDIRGLPDRISLLRFSGAHGRLNHPSRRATGK